MIVSQNQARSRCAPYATARRRRPAGAGAGASAAGSSAVKLTHCNTLNAGVKVDVAVLEKRDMTFLYRDGDDFVFMDQKTFDQMNISESIVGDAADYMLENCEANVAIHEGNPLYIDLPASVELTITYTEPGLQGDRSSGGTKPATLETGITVQVPLFIKQDEKVLVDTRTGAYLGRAN